MFKKLLKTGLGSCLAAATFCASVAAPVNALPLVTTLDGLAAADAGLVTQVQMGPQRPQRPPQKRPPQKRPPQRGFYKQKGHPYYNGHRGSPYRRPGYRQYNGWWFPLAAFTFGAIVGQGLTQAPPRGLSKAHYDWCYRKYRSYRASDNTFQPYHGPRKQCRSPYWP